MIRFALTIALLATPVFGDDVDSGTLPGEVARYLAQHCIACHGPTAQEANLRLDGVDGYRVENAPAWAIVHERIGDGEMPPTGEPRPGPEETKRVLAWIEQRARAARAEEGTGSARRLNRRELGAALRDVTGLYVDFSAALTADGTVDGFDTGAAGLQDAADSVARTLVVARRAVDGIRFLEPAESTTFAADLRGDRDTRKLFDPWKKDGASAKTRGIGREGEGLYMEPKWLGERGSTEFRIPVADDGRGIVRVTVQVAARTFFEGTPSPHLFVEIGGQPVDHREITGTLDHPQRLVYQVQLDDLPIGSKGLLVELSNRVEIPYSIEGFENEDKTKPDADIPGGPGLFRPVFDKKSRNPEEQPVPFVVLQEVSIETDYVAAWPPVEWEVDVGELVDDTATAERLLALWMGRAWRRPVEDDERERFRALYERLRGDGFAFDEALRPTFQSVLMSGPFRYLASPADSDETIAQHAIASRLSFMLTGGPPDAELRRLAAASRLRDGRVLDTQVDRLLADPRSEGFFQPFTTQWLEMEQPITIAMVDISQQDFRFGRYLKESMRAETIEYVATILRENRPASELVDADWTMMNDSLAVHYGYDGIEGGGFRRVPLRNGSERGGLMGHAGLQSMLCWMGDNWVIYRGAWTLRHILDDPPPPPPLEVPELLPSDGSNRGKSFKQLLEQHQNEPKCAVCHTKMDPLGFAFQNFDLSGRWREVEYERYERSELDGKISWQGKGEPRPVDATGRLPRGEEFESFAEFKRLVVEHYLRDVVRGVATNLVLYGTGRRPDVLDAIEMRAILDELEPKGFPTRDLLKSILRSRIFLES